MSRNSIFLMLKRLWGHISPRRRVQFGLLLMLTTLASIMETLSIGTVLPFLSVMVAPENIFNNPRADFFIKFFGINSPQDLLLPMIVSFVTIFFIATLVRLLLIWVTTRLTFATGADFSGEIYRRTLYQPYSVHIARNSSELITGVTAKSYHLIHNALMPLLIILNSGIMISIVMSVLIAVQPTISLLTLSGFVSIYVVVIFLVKRRLYTGSQLIAKESTKIVKALQEGLGGIRDVLIDGSQEIFCRIFKEADMPLRRAQGNITFISLSPRLVIEAIGMALMAGLAYWLSQQPGGLATAIPILGVLAVGAQRLLPVLQQAYGAWASLQGEVVSVHDALDLLDQPLPVVNSVANNGKLPFRNSIALSNLSFRYTKDGPLILNHIDLQIKKGERIGFIGSTGSGKSTLLDLIMGLLEPVNGNLKIDDVVVTASNLRMWQSQIAHVPQSIFLADSSVEENIAFGVPKGLIDHDRVLAAAKQAQISSFIEDLPEGYATSVGERGVRFSGGQRQRIGIARALYKKATVIILDEATSALDSETESAVIGAVEELGDDITVLMIAHRLSTLAGCNRVIELSQGSIVREGNYVEIVPGVEIDDK